MRVSSPPPSTLCVSQGDPGALLSVSTLGDLGKHCCALAVACLSWGCLFLFEELAEGAPEPPLGLVPRVVVAEGCLLIVILLAEPGVVFCMELLKGKRQFNQHLQPHILVPFSLFLFLSLCARRDLVGEEMLIRLGSNSSTSAESLFLALGLGQ